MYFFHVSPCPLSLYRKHWCYQACKISQSNWWIHSWKSWTLSVQCPEIFHLVCCAVGIATCCGLGIATTFRDVRITTCCAVGIASFLWCQNSHLLWCGNHHSFWCAWKSRYKVYDKLYSQKFLRNGIWCNQSWQIKRKVWSGLLFLFFFVNFFYKKKK